MPLSSPLDPPMFQAKINRKVINLLELHDLITLHSQRDSLYFRLLK